MKKHHNSKSFCFVIFLGVILYVSPSLGAIAKADPRVGGLEIGNGRVLVENQEGLYRFIVSQGWEIGRFKTFTEAIAPLSEGTPRTQIKANVLEGNLGYSAFLNKYKGLEGWKVSSELGELKGFVKETKSQGIIEKEYRIYRAGAELVVTINRAPHSSAIKGILNSFESMIN